MKTEQKGLRIPPLQRRDCLFGVILSSSKKKKKNSVEEWGKRSREDVLDSFRLTGYKLELSEKREPHLRKYLPESQL